MVKKSKSSRQSVNEGITDGCGNGAAAFSACSDDIRDVTFHNGFFRGNDVDEAYRDTDNQIRVNFVGFDEFCQAQEGCRGVANSDDEWSFYVTGFVHTRCGAGTAVFLSYSGDFRVGHVANLLSAQFFEAYGADASAGHVRIREDRGASFQSVQAAGDSVVAKAHRTGELKIGCRMDDAFNDIAFVFRQRNVT